MVDVDFLWKQLKTVFDPEIFVNIVDLGLVYGVTVADDGYTVTVDATLTSPGCPLADTIVGDIKNALLAIDSCKNVEVNLVFDPPWNKDMISEEGRMELGLI